MNPGVGGFFDRLGKAQSPRRRTPKAGRVAEKIESIYRQLALILNAHKGSASSAPDFGLGDFNDAAIGTADMMSLIANDIKVTINRYEPRIIVTEVVHQPHQDNLLELTFTINGHMDIDDIEENVEFEMTLDCLSHQWRNRRGA